MSMESKKEVHERRKKTERQEEGSTTHVTWVWKKDTRSQKVKQDESREIEERGVGPIKTKGVQKKS